MWIGRIVFFLSPGSSSLPRDTFQFLFIAKMVRKKTTFYFRVREKNDLIRIVVMQMLKIVCGYAIGHRTDNQVNKLATPSTIHEHETYWNLNMHFAFIHAITWGEIHKSCFRLSRTKVTASHDSESGVYFTASWTPCGRFCMDPMIGVYQRLFYHRRKFSFRSPIRVDDYDDDGVSWFLHRPLSGSTTSTLASEKKNCNEINKTLPSFIVISTHS